MSLTAAPPELAVAVPQRSSGRPCDAAHSASPRRRPGGYCRRGAQGVPDVDARRHGALPVDVRRLPVRAPGAGSRQGRWTGGRARCQRRGDGVHRAQHAPVLRAPTIPSAGGTRHSGAPCSSPSPYSPSSTSPTSGVNRPQQLRASERQRASDQALRGQNTAWPGNANDRTAGWLGRRRGILVR